MNGLLTICIPSFNRFSALDELLESLVDSCKNIEEIAEILFVDDGYDTKSIAYIIEKYKNAPKFKYHKNPIGGSFGAVYSECLKVDSSDFILVMNDDDILFPKGIIDSLGLLQTLPSVDIASPIWLSQSSRIIRGSRFRNKCLGYKQVLKYTAHAPGIIFRKSAVQDKIPILRKRLSESCTFSMMYPQVLLSALMIDDGAEIYSLSVEIGKDGHAFPTEIKSISTGVYFSLRSRVLQYSSLLEMKDQNVLSNKIQEVLCWNFLARIAFFQNRNTLRSIILFIIKRHLIGSYRNKKFKIHQLIKGRKSK